MTWHSIYLVLRYTYGDLLLIGSVLPLAQWIILEMIYLPSLVSMGSFFLKNFLHFESFFTAVNAILGPYTHPSPS